MYLYFEKHLDWMELARRTIKDSIQDDVPGIAAQLSVTISSLRCSPPCCFWSRWPAFFRSTVSRTS